MKNIIFWLVLAVAMLWIAMMMFAIAKAEAKSVNDLVITPMQEIEWICGEADLPEEEVAGCYLPATNFIFIKSDLPALEFQRVLFHEVGHYFLWGEDLSLFGNDKELAADLFAYWIMGYWIPQAHKNYFTELLIKI